MGYGRSMETIERRVALEARAMAKQRVMLKAINGEISWIQAAEILDVTRGTCGGCGARWSTVGSASSSTGAVHGLPAGG
jgi:hypothetical protein